MARLRELLDHVSKEKKITPDEVTIIRDHVGEDGKLDLADVRFLVELLVDSHEVCPQFDQLFFPVMKNVLLRDGRIDQSEQFYLLKMIYGDGVIRPAELEFLRELRGEAQVVTPEFEELCETARRAHPTEWSVEGDVTDVTSLAK